MAPRPWTRRTRPARPSPASPTPRTSRSPSGSAASTRRSRPRPYWEDFQLEIDPKERVLDALHKIKWELDGTLTFRRSCAHGICGSDAMRINGKNRLACKTLIKDINPEKPITVEAIKGLTVLKDLVVDMDPFFQAYRDVMPFLITKGNEPTRERLQSAEDRERFDDTTKCILCAACTSSCPVFWNDGQYFGPAAIVNAHRFIFDSRDEARRAAPGDPQRPGRRVALPHDVQLHGRLPARHRGHQGDPGGEARADHASLLIFPRRTSGPRLLHLGKRGPLVFWRTCARRLQRGGSGDATAALAARDRQPAA